MNVSDAVRQRHSVRAFKPEQPPAAMVRSILEQAARAPSGGNLQPWHVHALAGEPLAQLLQLVATAPMQEEPEYAVYPPELWEPYRTRRWRNAEQLYTAIGIPREERVARLQQMQKNAAFFGAPVGIFISMDRRMGPPQWADLGIYLQSLMLLAVHHGLATCAQGFWRRYAGTLQRQLALPEPYHVACGVALGYEDEAAPINALRSTRAPWADWGELRGFD